MSYAIANIIFGLPLEVEEGELNEDSPLAEAIENSDAIDGFHSYYSGQGGVNPAAFGVELDCFDECCFSIDIASLKLEPNESQRRKFYELWEHLDQELKTELERFGTPRTFILWSTS